MCVSQGNEKQIFRFKRQTAKAAVGAEPNAADRVGMSVGRGDHIADDEGRANVSGLAGRSVQEVRTMVDHAVVGGRAENTAVCVVAVCERLVLPQRFVAATDQPPRQLRQLHCS